MIRVANPFSNNQSFVPGVIFLASGLFTCIQSRNLLTSSSLKPLDRFSLDFIWSLLLMGIIKFFYWVCTLELDGHHAHIWYKTLKNLLLKNQKSFEAESWLHLGLKINRICLNDDPRMTFDVLTASFIFFSFQCFCFGKMWKKYFLKTR